MFRGRTRRPSQECSEVSCQCIWMGIIFILRSGVTPRSRMASAILLPPAETTGKMSASMLKAVAGSQVICAGGLDVSVKYLYFKFVAIGEAGRDQRTSRRHEIMHRIRPADVPTFVEKTERRAEQSRAARATRMCKKPREEQEAQRR